VRPDLDKAVDRALQRLEQGETKRAFSDITKLYEDNPDYHLTNYAMGAYRAAIMKDPAAFECLTASQFEQAVELFKRVLSENPDHVQSNGNLALAYAGLGRKSDALECFDRALELDPGYGPALLNRRMIASTREGEPFIPDGIQELHYYADKLRDQPG